MIGTARRLDDPERLRLRRDEQLRWDDPEWQRIRRDEQFSVMNAARDASVKAGNAAFKARLAVPSAEAEAEAAAKTAKAAEDRYKGCNAAYEAAKAKAAEAAKVKAAEAIAAAEAAMDAAYKDYEAEAEDRDPEAVKTMAPWNDWIKAALIWSDLIEADQIKADQIKADRAAAMDAANAAANEIKNALDRQMYRVISAAQSYEHALYTESIRYKGFDND